MLLYGLSGDICHISLKSGCKKCVKTIKQRQHIHKTACNAGDPVATHRVRSQGDPAPTAGAELGLAVGTQIPAAVRKFGLAADAAGGRVVPVSGRARRHRGLPDHRLPVAGQLLLDTSGGETDI